MTLSAYTVTVDESVMSASVLKESVFYSVLTSFSGIVQKRDAVISEGKVKHI